MTVTLERRDGVARITFTHPERRNALTLDEFELFRVALDEVSATPADRVLVISGSGGSFCAGADLSGGSPEVDVVAMMRQIDQGARALHRVPKPVIAAVDGVAVGAGMSIALGCDLVIASTRARFSQIFAKRGLSPDYGSSWLLPRVVGLPVAKRLAFLGDMVDGPQALGLGLISELCEPADLEEVVATLASRLASGPPIALAHTKRLLDQALGYGLDEALEQEAEVAGLNNSTEDTAEAIQAFLDKREPRFRGR